MADGAAHFDTTMYTLEQVIDLLVGLVEAGGAGLVSSPHLDLPRTDQVRRPRRCCCAPGDRRSGG